ncbi:OmpA family protein [Portibacter lacus]|uniref:Cell envelope biogenesis protein OmpA n=1 Tax=Portibacter lacus TaxID=1099794 RepID=A0AA37SUC5_9BACT|nr:OmpA family protein [Portibacter lacus]GLR18378.1 cell envelope biogenesis protein OmpA [Portibacter lacus]
MLIRLFLVSIILASLTSCVSSKKYKALESENRYQGSQIRSLELAKKKGEKAAADLASTRTELEQTKDILLDLNTKYNGLQESYDEIAQSYKEVLDQNLKLIDVTSREKTNLTNEINKKQEALDIKEKELDEKLEEIKESEARINELESLLQLEKTRMDSLQSRISNALFVFGPSDLSVEQKEGKIYVSLSQKLLFAKGSDNIDKQGKNALTKLAEVLEGRNDLDIIVEGHTDVDGDPNFNWDLSTKRATSVVKLLQQSGVNPDHLTASGRAFYEPIAKNDTESNKSKNRRTEIILSPKLDQVMELIRPK